MDQDYRRASYFKRNLRKDPEYMFTRIIYIFVTINFFNNVSAISDR